MIALVAQTLISIVGALNQGLKVPGQPPTPPRLEATQTLRSALDEAIKAQADLLAVFEQKRIELEARGDTGSCKLLAWVREQEEIHRGYLRRLQGLSDRAQQMPLPPR